MAGRGKTTTVPATPMTRFSARTNAVKRDSLAAELERDPQLSTAKRQQRTQAFSSHMAHTSLERQVAAAQTAKLELETKLREKEMLIERLEGDRRWLAEREKEEREEKEREREEHAEDTRKTDAEIRTLRSSLATLREQHVDLEEEHSSLSRSASQSITSQKGQISALTSQLSLVEAEMTQFKQLAEERSRAFEQLQAQFDDLSANQSFTLQSGQDEDWGVVREELHRQAKYMRQLESANARMTGELNVLREKQTSVEVLKEQKRELQRKLQGAEETREKMARLEAELEAARKEREEWASQATEPATPSKTPVSVTQSLATLRLTHAKLMEEHGSNVALLKRRDHELAEVQEREAAAQETIKKLHAEVRTLKDRATRSEHKVTLADREVSFLQAMLASFSAEEAAQDVKSENDPLKSVQDAEALIKDYKATVASLERDLEGVRARSVTPEDAAAMKKLRVELQEARTAKEEAERALEEADADAEKQLEQIEELEQTLFELRGETGAGRHLPPGVRVLSMRDNPAQQWEDLSRAAMDRLKNENEALLKRLKDLEDSGIRGGGQSAQGDDLVPRESWEVLNEEKAKLQDELKQKEKRLLRLQQVFTAKSTEFREAIQSILGFKLAFYPNGQVRVTSTYDLNAAFVFQPQGQGGEGPRMQLVAQGEGGPEELPQLMQYWVAQEECIPGFLASVTLECYEKSKRDRRLMASQ
ncbi:MAD-domain-containing protein [Epithele typhae]|uniref:MAD-domain-containing protein n=1 Tax=Epithele typhae TaxID=378194 RepID=UPI00200798A0|nr:MAD-domain-containing protein [Epithele typhae]KAH9938791.1 MAD-domain-containing protein [Epithele typhae]